IVRRVLNGVTRRYVEVVEDGQLAAQGGIAQSFYVDCGISRPGGSPTLVVTGLDHLEGCLVDILADGNPHPRRTVEDGEITLDFEASVVHV
ncbi:hypothetical protein ABTH85_18755, partial [Acinetobacter baumannii]